MVGDLFPAGLERRLGGMPRGWDLNARLRERDGEGRILCEGKATRRRMKSVWLSVGEHGWCHWTGAAEILLRGTEDSFPMTGSPRYSLCPGGGAARGVELIHQPPGRLRVFAARNPWFPGLALVTGLYVQVRCGGVLVRLGTVEHCGTSASTPAGRLLPVGPGLEPAQGNLRSSGAFPVPRSLPSCFCPLSLGCVSEVTESWKPEVGVGGVRGRS